MPYLQSYLETIRQQFSPTIESFLTEQFPSFEEKAKHPDSPEKKTLDTVIAMIANISFAEKAANDAQAFIYYLNDMAEKDDFTLHHQAESFKLYDDEENKAEKIDFTAMLLSMSAQLAEIQARKDFLQAQFQKNMSLLNTQENQMIKAYFEIYGINPSTVAQYNQFYAERSQGRAKRLETVKKVIQVESILDNIINEIKQEITPPENQKLDDIKMEKLLREGVQETAKRMAEGLKNTDHVAKNDSVGSQIILFGMLKEELGDKYNQKVLLELSRDIHNTANGFTLLKEALEDHHQGAMKILDERAKEIQAKQKNLTLASTRVSPSATKHDNVALDEEIIRSTQGMTLKPGGS